MPLMKKWFKTFCGGGFLKNKNKKLKDFVHFTILHACFLGYNIHAKVEDLSPLDKLLIYLCEQ